MSAVMAMSQSPQSWGCETVSDRDAGGGDLGGSSVIPPAGKPRGAGAADGQRPESGDAEKRAGLVVVEDEATGHHGGAVSGRMTAGALCPCGATGNPCMAAADGRSVPRAAPAGSRGVTPAHGKRHGSGDAAARARSGVAEFPEANHHGGADSSRVTAVAMALCQSPPSWGCEAVADRDAGGGVLGGRSFTPPAGQPRGAGAAHGQRPGSVVAEERAGLVVVEDEIAGRHGGAVSGRMTAGALCLCGATANPRAAAADGRSVARAAPDASRGVIPSHGKRHGSGDAAPRARSAVAEFPAANHHGGADSGRMAAVASWVLGVTGRCQILSSTAAAVRNRRRAGPIRPGARADRGACAPAPRSDGRRATSPRGVWAGGVALPVLADGEPCAGAVCCLAHEIFWVNQWGQMFPVGGAHCVVTGSQTRDGLCVPAFCGSFQSCSAVLGDPREGFLAIYERVGGELRFRQMVAPVAEGDAGVRADEGIVGQPLREASPPAAEGGAQPSTDRSSAPASATAPSTQPSTRATSVERAPTLATAKLFARGEAASAVGTPRPASSSVPAKCCRIDAAGIKPSAGGAVVASEIACVTGNAAPTASCRPEPTSPGDRARRGSRQALDGASMERRRKGDVLEFRDPDVWRSTIDWMQSGVAMAPAGGVCRRRRCAGERSSRRSGRRRALLSPLSARASPERARRSGCRPSNCGRHPVGSMSPSPHLPAGAGERHRDDLRKKFGCAGCHQAVRRGYGVEPSSASTRGARVGAPSEEIPVALLTDGNCVLAALWHLATQIGVSRAPLTAAASATSVSDRSYADSLASVGLVGALMEPDSLRDDGLYLAHCLAGERAHCVAVVAGASQSWATVHDGSQSERVDRGELVSIIQQRTASVVDAIVRVERPAAPSGSDVGAEPSRLLSRGLRAGARAPARDTVEPEFVAEGFGSARPMSLRVLGMHAPDTPSLFLSSLLRSLRLLDDGPLPAAPALSVIGVDGARALRLVVEPGALRGARELLTDARDPVLCIVDCALGDESIARALHHVEAFARAMCPCLVVLASVRSPGFSLTRGIDILAWAAERGCHVLTCDSTAPNQEVWVTGARGLLSGWAVDPWVCAERLDRLAMVADEVTRPADPDADAPASLWTFHGVPLSMPPPGELRRCVLLTLHATDFDVEVGGLLPWKGLWCSVTATIADLRSEIQRLAGCGNRLRFSLSGRPLLDEDLVVDCRGVVLRASQRMPGGAMDRRRTALSSAAASSAHEQSGSRAAAPRQGRRGRSRRTGAPASESSQRARAARSLIAAWQAPSAAPTPAMQLVAATVQIAAARGRERVQVAFDLNARELCLALAFLALGYQVEISPNMRGPLRAIADGTAMLRPLRARIFRVLLGSEISWLEAGSYVLWHRHHFLPMRIRFAGWVVVPAECALFCIVRGKDADAYDEMWAMMPSLRQARERNRARMGQVAGALVFARLMGDREESDACEARLARLLSVEGEVEARIMALLSHRADVVGGHSVRAAAFDVGRRVRNRLAHALNGNGAMPPIDEDLDVAGPGATAGCYLFGMCDVAYPSGVFSELIRAAIEQSVSGDLVGDAVRVRPLDTSSTLSVVVKPRALSAPTLPRMDLNIPIVAVVNLSAPRIRVDRALDQLRQLGRDGWLVLVLLANTAAAGLGHRAAVGLLVALCRDGLHGALCDDRAPSWSVIYRGVTGLVNNDALPPWSDGARVARRALEAGMLPRPLDPGEDAPASWATVRGPPLDFVEAATPPANVVLTDSLSLWDIELRGIEGVRGVWVAPDATLRDLCFAVVWRYGLPLRWRFHAHGLPLRAESPLGDLRGAILRATPRAAAGAVSDVGEAMAVERIDLGAASSAASSSTARPADGAARGLQCRPGDARPAPRVDRRSQEGKRRRVSVARDGEESVRGVAERPTSDSDAPTSRPRRQEPAIAWDPADFDVRPEPAPRVRPPITERHEPPEHPPQLSDDDAVCVAVPPDGRCLLYTAMAARNAREWLRAHPRSGHAADPARAAADRQAADALKADMIRMLKAAKKDDDAALLEDGAYPGLDEVMALCTWLNGQVVVQVGELQVVKGSGPLRAHIRYCQAIDGAGVAAPHFELFQSWCPLPVTEGSTECAPEDDMSQNAQPRDADSDGETCVVPVSGAPGGDFLPDDVEFDGTFADVLARRIELGRPRDEADDIAALFDSLIDADASVTAAEEPDPCPVDRSIRAVVARQTELVKGMDSTLPDSIVALLVTAVTTRDWRLLACALSDLVPILHMALGVGEEPFIIAHDGVTHFWGEKSGVWERYEGFVPHYIPQVLKAHLLRAAGILRMCPPAMERADARLVAEVGRLFVARSGTVEEFLSEAQTLAVVESSMRPEKGSARARVAEASDAAASQADGMEDALDASAFDAPPKVSHKAPWAVRLAANLTFVAGRMEFMLYGKQLLQYYAGWCDAPRPSVSGIGYLDSAYLYDDSGLALRRASVRERRSLYIGIPHNLLGQKLGDPCLSAAVDRVRLFYSRTFWSNGRGYRACLCALALAKRGVNVDAVFYLLGPGGVGLSLATTHLDSMLGPTNHKFFDPQVFHLDEEMRKTVERLEGALVLTAQERPEGMGKQCRVDLVKKVASADGLFGRLPYSILTKVICLVGWKRMECNSMLRFKGVTERNFHSIFRRSLVIWFRSRFVDPDTFKKLSANAPDAGLYPQDTDLKRFLTSGPAVLAGLRMQHAFELKTSRSDCERFIKRYTYGRGDDGMTERVMRTACDLPQRAPAHADATDETGAQAGSVMPPGIDLELSPPGNVSGGEKAEPRTSSIQMPADNEETMKEAHAAVVSCLLSRKLDSVSASFVERTWRPPAHLAMPPGKRLVWWERFQRSDLFASYPSRLKCVGHKWPRLPGMVPVVELTDSRSVPGVTELEEAYAAGAFIAWATDDVRLRNAGVLTDALRCCRMTGRRRGRPSAKEQPFFDTMEEAGRSAAAVEATIARLVSLLQLGVIADDTGGATESMSLQDVPTESLGSSFAKAGAATGRQRMRKKSPDATSASQSRPDVLRMLRGSAIADAGASSSGIVDASAGAPVIVPVDSLLRRTVRYRRSAMEARRVAETLAAQSLPARALSVLVPHTVDLDIENAAWVLTHQLVERMKIVPAGVHEDLATLEEVATNRDSLIADELQCSRAEGKELLLTLLSGGAVPARWESNDLCQRVSRLARVLRWVACTALPEVYAIAQADERPRPELTTFAIFWQRAEAFVLDAWANFLLQARPRHLSLHFDGLRVDRASLLERFDSVDAACTACVEYIQRHTGFAVSIREKTHLTLLQLLEQHPGSPDPVPLGAEVLALDGNCILLGMWRLRDIVANDALAVAKTGAPLDRRSYRSCFEAGHAISASAHLGFCPRSPGAYLVHAENVGRAHCVAVSVGGEREPLTVFSHDRKWSVDRAAFVEWVSRCSDRRTVVSFQLAPFGRAPVPMTEPGSVASLDGLLELTAGAAKTDRLPSADALSAGSAKEHESVATVAPGAERLSQSVNSAKRRRVIGKQAEADEVARMGVFVTAEGVREHFRASLRAECDRYAEIVASHWIVSELPLAPVARRKGVRCELCPFLELSGSENLLRHLDEDHVDAVTFAPAGSKQLRLARAIFDQDAVEGCRRGAYLRRSAEMMRRFPRPWPSSRLVCVDRCLAVVLRGDGARYELTESVWRSSTLRFVGYFAYDRGFAEVLLREALAHHGRIRPTRRRVVAWVSQGDPVSACLCPLRCDTWLALLEDVMNSPAAMREAQRTLEAYRRGGEFAHLSIDATFRVMRGLRGQAPFNAARRQRSSAVVPESQAVYRLLTVVGASSSFLAAVPVRDESAAAVCAALGGALAPVDLEQVLTVRSDAPSAVLVRSLKSVLPNLRFVALDPVHLAMRFESAHGGRRTRGSRVLRALMSRFSAPADATHALPWGSAYEGGESPVRLSPAMVSHQELILSGELPETTARSILRDLDMTLAWETPLHFARALAALSSVFSAELNATIPRSGMSLRRLLYLAAEPRTMQWYFNNSRARGLVPAGVRRLMAVGTTANEAVHAELNRWFRNQPESFADTVRLQVRVALMAKGMAHAIALYRPTLRQVKAVELLARAVSAWTFPPEEWVTWCADLKAADGTCTRAPVPMRGKVKALARRLAARRLRESTIVPRGSVRFLANDRLLAESSAAHRGPKPTAFSLRRAGSLKRSRGIQ